MSALVRELALVRERALVLVSACVGQARVGSTLRHSRECHDLSYHFLLTDPVYKSQLLVRPLVLPCHRSARTYRRRVAEDRAEDDTAGEGVAVEWAPAGVGAGSGAEGCTVTADALLPPGRRSYVALHGVPMIVAGGE